MNNSNQKWRKLGLVFSISNPNGFMNSHTAAPIAIHLNDNLYKIYFTTRNDTNRSEITFIIADLSDNFKVIEVNNRRLLELGSIGSFDEDGIWAANILCYKNLQYMYYIGWNRGINVPFRNSIGLAISENNGQSFQKISKGPILDRSIFDPCFVASNEVLLDDGIFKMWYLSCFDWFMENGKPMHKYHIKYAESKDGINWLREGRIAIDFRYKEEYAISVPRIIKENNMYKMWYSYRGSPKTPTYRIGYAESLDGMNWIRKDEEVGIDISPSGWDSEMICYPFIFDHKGKRYMLYNGNGYGKTGFGLAVLEAHKVS